MKEHFLYDLRFSQTSWRWLRKLMRVINIHDTYCRILSRSSRSAKICDFIGLAITGSNRKTTNTWCRSQEGYGRSKWRMMVVFWTYERIWSRYGLYWCRPCICHFRKIKRLQLCYSNLVSSNTEWIPVSTFNRSEKFEGICIICTLILWITVRIGLKNACCVSWKVLFSL